MNMRIPWGLFSIPASLGFGFVWGGIWASAFSKTELERGCKIYRTPLDHMGTASSESVWKSPCIDANFISVLRWLKMGEALAPESWELCMREGERVVWLMGVNPVSWSSVWWCASRGHPRNTTTSAISGWVCNTQRYWAWRLLCPLPFGLIALPPGKSFSHYSRWLMFLCIDY